MHAENRAISLAFHNSTVDTGVSMIPGVYGFSALTKRMICPKWVCKVVQLREFHAFLSKGLRVGKRGATTIRLVLGTGKAIIEVQFSAWRLPWGRYWLWRCEWCARRRSKVSQIDEVQHVLKALVLGLCTGKQGIKELRHVHWAGQLL